VEKCEDSLSLLPSLRGKIRQRNGGERRSLVVTGRGHGMTRRVWSVATAVRRGSLGFCTGVFGHSRDWRVRSSAQRDCRTRGVDRTWWRVLSVTIECVRSQKTLSGPFLYSEQTSCVPRPVSSTARLVGASRAQALCDRRVRSLDDRWGVELTIEILRSSFEGEDTWTAMRPVTSTGASGHCENAH
jgi:hypothetical protein